MEKITVLGTQNPVGLRNAINETLGQQDIIDIQLNSNTAQLNTLITRVAASENDIEILQQDIIDIQQELGNIGEVLDELNGEVI